MDDQQAAARQQSKDEAVKREMYRSSMDLIRVYNPTDEDFSIIWGEFKHVVPNKNKDIGYGKGQRVVQRYLAMWYLKHMADHIINQKQDAELRKVHAQLEKEGVEDSLLKANQLVERKRELRTDNQEEIKKIAEVIWLGLEERFGLDEQMAGATKAEIQDQRPIHEQIADTLKNKRVAPVETAEPVRNTTEYPINKAKKKLVEEVSNG